MRDSKGMHVSAREVGRSKQLGAELKTILVLDLAGFSVQIRHLAYHNIFIASVRVRSIFAGFEELLRLVYSLSKDHAWPATSTTDE